MADTVLRSGRSFVVLYRPRRRGRLDSSLRPLTRVAAPRLLQHHIKRGVEVGLRLPEGRSLYRFAKPVPANLEECRPIDTMSDASGQVPLPAPCAARRVVSLLSAPRTSNPKPHRRAASAAPSPHNLLVYSRSCLARVVARRSTALQLGPDVSD